MATYFKEPNTTYYNILNNARGKEQAIEKLLNDIDALVTSNKNVIFQMESAQWNELGKRELLESVMPKLSDCIDIFRENVQNNLNGAVSVAFDELLPLLEDLKAKAEEWDSLNTRINSNNNSGIDNSSNIQEINSVGNDITELSRKINAAVKKIKDYSSLLDFPTNNVVSQISKLNLNNTNSISRNYDFDIVSNNSSNNNNNNNNNTNNSNKYNNNINIYGPTEHTNNSSNTSINSYTSYDGGSSNNTNNNVTNNDNVYESFKDKISSYLNSSTNLYSEPYTNSTSSSSSLTNKNYNSGDVTTWSTLGANFIVANTKLSMAEYAALAYNRGIRQDSNTGRYGDLCLAFSEVHCQNLYRGNTSDNAETAYRWGRSTEFQDFMTNDKSELMAVIYDQIMSGKPCVLQVNGNVQGTSRHFVTVLGFKDTVTSAADLTEDDLLIMDSWDAKVERMDQANSRFITNGKQTGNGYTGYYLRILKG